MPRPGNRPPRARRNALGVGATRGGARRAIPWPGGLLSPPLNAGSGSRGGRDGQPAACNRPVRQRAGGLPPDPYRSSASRASRCLPDLARVRRAVPFTAEWHRRGRRPSDDASFAKSFRAQFRRSPLAPSPPARAWGAALGPDHRIPGLPRLSGPSLRPAAGRVDLRQPAVRQGLSKRPLPRMSRSVGTAINLRLASPCGDADDTSRTPSAWSPARRRRTVGRPVPGTSVEKIL